MGIVRKPEGAIPTLDPIALAFPWPVTPTVAVWTASNIARAARNLAAPRRPALSVVGAPAVANTGMIFDINNHLSALASETPNQTLIAAVRSDADQSSNALRIAPLGWRGLTGSQGHHFFSGGSLMRTVAPYMVGEVLTARTCTLTLPAGWQSTWGLYAAVQEAGVGMRLHALTLGTVASLAEASDRVLLQDAPYRIGTIDSGLLGQCQTMFAAIIPAALTLAELQTLRAAISARSVALHGVPL